MSDVDPRVRGAWRRALPDVTDDEIRALLPIVLNGTGRLRSLVVAYRAGVAATMPLPAPLAGFEPCPECLSVYVVGVTFVDGRMTARCGNCSTYYDAATGQPYPAGTAQSAGDPAPVVPLRPGR